MTHYHPVDNLTEKEKQKKRRRFEREQRLWSAAIKARPIVWGVMIALFIVIVTVIYSLIWGHFHDTGFWNFLSVMAILFVAIGPTYFNGRQEHIRREQEYENNITKLMLEHHLRHAEKDTEVRRVARVMTLGLFERSNGTTKGKALVFLKRSGLIDADNPVISLRGADLSSMRYPAYHMDNINLEGASLRDSKLVFTQFNGSNLSHADLSGAKLQQANFKGANLTNAQMTDTNLNGAKVDEATLQQAVLVEPSTIMPNGKLWYFPRDENGEDILTP